MNDIIPVPKAEYERLRKDAKRYRWLRTHFRFANDSMREIWFDENIDLAGAYGAHEPDELDTAIDTAMYADMDAAERRNNAIDYRAQDAGPNVDPAPRDPQED